MELIKEGRPLPIKLENEAIYYMGPSPARPGRIIGSAGPTTSSRMDFAAPTLLDLGLAVMIGKGKRRHLFCRDRRLRRPHLQIHRIL